MQMPDDLIINFYRCNKGRTAEETGIYKIYHLASHLLPHYVAK